MSADSREIYTKGHTYVITRRFLNKTTGRMRVRVVAYKGLLALPDRKVMDEFRDYDDMHVGDRIFAGHIKAISEA